MRDVLVVDDEVGMRAALEASFRRQGWKVMTAGGKNEAVAALRSAPCSLVVTDMRMGDGSGLDVVSGMHNRLGSHPALKAAAHRFGRRLIDVRQPPANIPIATGAIALICVAEAYVSGAGFPSNSTCTPPSEFVIDLPPEASCNGTPAVGPMFVPNSDTISPGAAVPVA